MLSEKNRTFLLLLLSLLLTGAALWLKTPILLLPELFTFALILSGPGFSRRGVSPLKAALLTGLGSFLGAGLARLFPERVLWAAALALLGGWLLLSVFGADFPFLYSAVLFPVLLKADGLLYPVFMTAGAFLLAGVSLRLGTREKSPPPEGRKSLLKRLFLPTLLFLVLIAFPADGGLYWLASPSLAAVFFDFSDRQSPVRQKPGPFLLGILLSCVGGALLALAAEGLSVPAAVFAPLALGLALLIHKKTGLYAGAGLALLALLVPAGETLLYPLQAVIGGGMGIYSALLVFRKTAPAGTGTNHDQP